MDIKDNKDNPLDAGFIAGNKKPASFAIPANFNLQSILEQYKGDNEFNFNRTNDGRSPYQKFLEEHFFIKDQAGKWAYNPKPTAQVTGKVLCAGLIECTNQDGDEYTRPTAVRARIRNADDFIKYLKASEQPSQLREALIESTNIFSAGSYDNFANSEIDDFSIGQTLPIAKGDVEYTPIMGGPFSKQLYLFDFLSMHAKAFEMWNHNPVAHQIIKITTYFTLGRGVQVKCKSPAAQKVWDHFEARNRFYHNLKNHWMDELSRDGELNLRIFKDTIGDTGDVTVRKLDPSTIWEIVTDPEDVEKIYYYHQQYPTPYQVFYEVNPLDIPSTKYVINHIPANEVLHYKINCDSGEKRGRSDLYPVMTWLKRLKDFYTARVIRAIMQSCVVWKNVIDGDSSDVQTYVNNYGTNPPLAGSVHVENKASTLSAMTVDIKAADARDDGEALLNLISVGVGIPKQYLGLGSESAKATAVVASEPGMKKFQDRQEIVKLIIKDVVTVVLDEAMRAGKLPETEKALPEQAGRRIIDAIKKADYWTAAKLLWMIIRGGQVIELDRTFDVIIPELIIEDRSAKIKDLTLMYVNKWISRETASTISAKEMHIDEFDYKAEAQKISKDSQDELYGPDLAPEMSGTGGIRYKPVNKATGQPGPDKPTAAPDKAPKQASGVTGKEKFDIQKAASEAGMAPEFLEAFIKEINGKLKEDLSDVKTSGK